MNRTLIASALLATSAFAQAQSQAYVIGTLGLSSFDISEDDVNASFLSDGFSAVRSDIEADSGMLKIGLGLELAQYLAVETSFTYLGFTEADAVTAGPSAAISMETSTYGIEAVLLGKYALDEDTRIFGKVGGFAWESETETDAIGGGLLISGGTTTTDGTDMTVGAGVEYKVWRFEYQRYTLDDTDVDTFQVSYQFNL